jgi:hypothetical protein
MHEFSTQNQYISIVEHSAAKLLKSYPTPKSKAQPLQRGQDKYHNFLEDKQKLDRKLADDELLCVNDKHTRPTTLPVTTDESFFCLTSGESLWCGHNVQGMPIK